MKVFKGTNGELVEVVLPLDADVEVAINGAPAKLLVAGAVDAAKEKHVPEVKLEDGKVKVQVGSTLHPMLENHWITNIWIEYADGSVEKATLLPGEQPVAEFDPKDKKGVATVYEYCNLHGLWKAEIEL